MEATELLSITQAAERLHLKRQSVHEAIQQGRLPAQQIGRQWVIRASDVAAYQPRAYEGRRGNLRPAGVKGVGGRPTHKPRGERGETS